MALRPPRRGGKAAVAVALTTAVAALAVVAVTVGLSFVRGDRPEEEVAEQFLSRLVAGDGAGAHALTSPTYQALVTPRDLEELATAMARTVSTTRIEVLGSERTAGADPLRSLVGYEAQTRVGTLRGVVTLVEREAGRWRVRDASYRFPDADPGQVARVREVTARLNAQVAERSARRSRPAP